MTRTTATSRGPRGLRTVSLAAGVALAAVVLLPGAAASTVEGRDESSWNEMEHEARRSLAEAQQEQDVVLNPREHEANRSSPADSPAGRATIPRTCAEALDQAWEDLGHYSDGLERHLMGTPACTTS